VEQFALQTSVLRRLSSAILARRQLRQELAACPDFTARELIALERLLKRAPKWGTLEREVAGYLDLDLGDPQDALKFLQVDFWLRTNILRAVRLHLHRQSPMTILDVGCGPAMFPFVCRFWGHHAVGLDQSPDHCGPAERLVYAMMPAVLGIPVQRQTIQAFVPIELSQRYDLVCAFMICFNQHQRPQEWTCEEWRFFLQDLCQHINPSGRIHLALNDHSAKYGQLQYYDESTLTLFTTWGRVEGGGRVTVFRDRVVAEGGSRSLGTRASSPVEPSSVSMSRNALVEPAIASSTAVLTTTRKAATNAS
jgi:SAM-dependent methyltransferase